MVGKQARKKKVSRTKKSRVLLQKQLAMPAGFYSDDSSVATLREVVDPAVPTKQLSELTLEQRAELVAERLALQPSLDLAMIGAGMIDKQRAITEVKGKTRVGKVLIEIEHRLKISLSRPKRRPLRNRFDADQIARRPESLRELRGRCFLEWFGSVAGKMIHEITVDLEMVQVQGGA